MEISGNLGFEEKPRKLVSLDFNHEFWYGIESKLYIWAREVMSKFYLSKSGHVGPRAILLTFRAELGIYINWIIISTRVYFYWFAHYLASFGALDIDLNRWKGLEASYEISKRGKSPF